MGESIYLLSNNHLLIKHFIDYSMSGDTIELVGINTSKRISAKEIEGSNASILIVDEMDVNREINYILNELIKETMNTKLIVFYISNEVSKEVDKSLNVFAAHHCIMGAYNFFDLLYLIEKRKKNRNNEGWIIEGSIVNQLYRLMISTNLLGFDYLKEAILLKHNHPNIKMAEIYDRIARENNTLSTRVDRCMRTAISNSFKEHSNIFLSYAQFDKKPSCMNFITRLSYAIKH